MLDAPLGFGNAWIPIRNEGINAPDPKLRELKKIFP